MDRHDVRVRQFGPRPGNLTGIYDTAVKQVYPANPKPMVQLVEPMPLPDHMAWIRVPVMALFALLAWACWRGARAAPTR